MSENNIFEETNEEGSLQETIQANSARVVSEPNDLTLADWSTTFQNNALVAKYMRKSSTVTQTRNVFKKEPHKEQDPTIDLSQLPNKVMYEAMLTLPDETLDEEDPRINEWFESMARGSRMQPADDALVSSLAREGSDWQQHLANGDQKLNLSRVRIRDSRSDDRAALRVLSALSVGGAYSVPLWHSGFWITLRKPSNSALMDLENRLLTEKVRFSRTTYGRVLSHMTAFTSSVMLDFIIEHIYATNLENRESIAELILAPDIPVLAWELAAIIWTKGWNYSRPIVGSPDQPNLIVNQRIDVATLGWVDNSRFDEFQRAHMAKRSETVTIKEVKDYQSRFTLVQGRVFKLTDENEDLGGETIYIKLKTPSANQYVTMGMRWINDIVHTYDSVAGSGRTSRERDDYVDKHSKATALRMYDHYVSEIIIRNEEGEEEVQTSDAVRQTVLDHLSSDEAKRKIFMDAVKAFIDDSVVALVAVPVYDSAELEEVPQLPRFPYMIPIDPINLFFTLLVRSMNRVRALENNDL